MPILRTRQQVSVAIFTLLGRVFMPPIDCPFNAADRVLAALPADVRVILVDFHAEATSDKQLMGRHLDGRVSAVLGTHTHVPTADETILPGGTAFHCDVGMTGPHESILGRRIDRVMETTRTSGPPIMKWPAATCGSTAASSTSIRKRAMPPRSGESASMKRRRRGWNKVEASEGSVAVCQCFAEAVRSVTSCPGTACSKQWHTAVRMPP